MTVTLIVLTMNLMQFKKYTYFILLLFCFLYINRNKMADKREGNSIPNFSSTVIKKKKKE